MPGADQVAFLEEKIAKGEYATKEELKPFVNGNRHKDKGVGGIAVGPNRLSSLGCSSWYSSASVIALCSAPNDEGWC